MAASDAAAELTRHVYDLVLAGRRDLLRQLLVDDFALAGTRERLDREGWIELMVDQTQWEAISVERVATAVDLDNVVVTAALVRYRGRRHDEPLTGHWHVIDVWQQRGMNWGLLSRTTFPAA